MSTDTGKSQRGPAPAAKEKSGGTHAETAMPRRPHDRESNDRIRAAYECHTLAQMLFERLAGVSPPRASQAFFAMQSPPPMPWPYPGMRRF